MLLCPSDERVPLWDDCPRFKGLSDTTGPLFFQHELCFVLFWVVYINIYIYISCAFSTGEFLPQEWCCNRLYEKCPQLGAKLIFALQHLLLWCLHAAALESKRIQRYKNYWKKKGKISLEAPAGDDLTVNFTLLGISWSSVSNHC